MTITLISEDQFKELTEINEKFPVLFLQNEGYQYIRKEFTEEESEARKKVVSILSNHIKGFSDFHNFRKSKKTDELQVRFDYNWEADAEHPCRSFIGVGYITLNELKNGFKK